MKPASSRILCCTFLLAACAALPVASAKEIYTWTDENGVIHFVDTPPQVPGAVTIEAAEAYRPGSSDAYPPAAPEASRETASPAGEPSAAERKRQEIAEKRAAAEARQAEVDVACAEARSKLPEYESSRRVFYTDAAGETVRMDDVERTRLVEELKDFIEQNCL